MLRPLFILCNVSDDLLSFQNTQTTCLQIKSAAAVFQQASRSYFPRSIAFALPLPSDILPCHTQCLLHAGRRQTILAKSLLNGGCAHTATRGYHKTNYTHLRGLLGKSA